MKKSSDLEAALAGDEADREALRRGEHADPHRYLGPHRARVDRQRGLVARAFHPAAKEIEIVPADGEAVAMEKLEGGVFAAWLPGRGADKGEKNAEPLLDYRLRLRFPEGGREERGDPYRHPPTIGELDLHLIGEGNHLRLWESLGARPAERFGERGFAFSVWAPNARRVSLVGDFCRWDGRLFPMRRPGSSGIFDLFCPGLEAGTIYKYEILAADGTIQLKADPLARWAERPPETASRTFRSSYAWGDGEWMAAVAGRDVAREPMATYEVHLGSWLPAAIESPRTDGVGAKLAEPSGSEVGEPEAEAPEPGAPRPEAPQPTRRRYPSYREIGPKLADYVSRLGFNYVELMPVCEHPYDGSWGYQVTGYYAPTARYGDPDDLRRFVDACHRRGIGVILDWVPAHFVTDAHGLGRFDGTALYEHEDPRRGLHPDWGTYIFNYGRHEVRNFLLANALYWFEEFHVDGLRADAVASMLYLDYSRDEGEWIPNAEGGRENLDAIALLRAINLAVGELYPGRFLVAEESTAWPRVTHPVADGGLGFALKWNLGWMHDTLSYFQTDPLFRSGCHDQLTFGMMYEHSERFVNPLSHDEVVHLKGSLYDKMPGDPWRKLANLRALFAYQFTRPGKKLLFMGSELAPAREWSHETSLDWYLLGDPGRQGLFRFLGDLGALYREHPCLWATDPDPEGFAWISCDDRTQSILSYERRTSASKQGDRRDRLLVVLNLTPVPRPGYRIGAPLPGRYRVLMSSDAERYGGSGYPVVPQLTTATTAADGHEQSLVLDLPPLAALVLEPERVDKRKPRDL